MSSIHNRTRLRSRKEPLTPWCIAVYLAGASYGMSPVRQEGGTFCFFWTHCKHRHIYIYIWHIIGVKEKTIYWHRLIHQADDLPGWWISDDSVRISTIRWHVSIYIYICVFIYLFIYLFIHLFIYLFIYLCTVYTWLLLMLSLLFIVIMYIYIYTQY